MTLPPGMPERDSFADRFQTIDRRLDALERASRGAISSDGTDTYLTSGDFRISEEGAIRIGADLVVLDADGLTIGGILQPALAVLTEQDSANPTLTTTLTTINDITFTIPSWADEVTVVTIARLQNIAAPAGNYVMTNTLVNDVGGLDAATDDAVRIASTGSSVLSSTVALSTTVSSPGSSILCRQRAKIETSTLSSEARLEGFAIVRRTS